MLTGCVEYHWWSTKASFGQDCGYLRSPTGLRSHGLFPGHWLGINGCLQQRGNLCCSPDLLLGWVGSSGLRVVEKLLMSQLQWCIVRDQRVHCRHILSQEPCLHVRVRQFSLHYHRLDNWSPGTILSSWSWMALVLRILCHHHRRCHVALVGSVLGQLPQSSACGHYCFHQVQAEFYLRDEILRR